MHGTTTHLRTAREAATASRYAQNNPPAEQQSLMVGGSAFKLSIFGQIHTLSTRLYTTKAICRHPAPPRLGRNASSTCSWLGNLSCGASAGSHALTCSSGLTTLHHSSSCLLKDGIVGATIWHTLVPSSRLYVDRCGRQLIEDARASKSLKAGNCRGVAVAAGTALLSSGNLDGLVRRFPSTTAYRDGSWNVAGDARPARWLHGRHSAWLLFGFCSCFSAATSSGSAVACCESNATPTPFSSPESEVQVQSHGKVVYKEFSVIGIPADGRCLFRAVAHGVCARQGKPTSNEDSQRELADELRSKVVDELVKRRSESEWFIEGDFDLYTERMRESHVWGGEPELLMLSHVLKLPITVHMFNRSSDGIIAIAEYGQEYGKDKPIRVLYHGFGHYDALQMPGDGAHSKL